MCGHTDLKNIDYIPITEDELDLDDCIVLTDLVFEVVLDFNFEEMELVLPNLTYITGVRL